MAATQQRGQMIQRGTNKWLLRIYRGEHPSAKTKAGQAKKLYSSKAFKGSTAQARQALTAMLRQDDTKTFVPTSALTVRDYLDRWLDEKKIDVSPRTLVSYDGQLMRVKDALGDHKLTDLDSLMIQRLVTSMVEHRHAITKKPLSPRSIQYTIRIFRGAMADAVRRKILVFNPVSDVRVPRKVKRAATVLSNVQVNALLEQTKGDPSGPLWRLLLTTGMRPQEAFALKWSDLDLDTGSVSIHRTLVADGRGNVSLDESTKAESQRSLSLPASTVEALKDHRKVQVKHIFAAGKEYERLDLVFANRFGRPLDVARVRRWWKKTLKDTKNAEGESLPAIRLYDTRHTHLTGLLQGGLDIAFVAERAGHKDISMTVAHYAHVTPESRRMIGDFTEQMLARAR